MTNARVVHGPGFKIRYEEAPGFLRAHVFDGQDSVEVSQAMWRMLGAECRTVGLDRLLVLEDLASTVDAAGIEVVIASMLQAGFASRRTAFVELREDIQGSELGEILCCEHGIVARVFSNEDQARRWLLYDA